MSVLVRKIFPFLKNCLFKKNLTHPEVIYPPTLLREFTLSFSEGLNSNEGHWSTLESQLSLPFSPQMGPYFCPTVLHLTSLVVEQVPTLFAPLLYSQLGSSQPQKMPGVVWSSTDFSGSFPLTPMFSQHRIRGHCQRIRYFCGGSFQPLILSAPRPPLFPRVCLALPQLPPPIALFSASYYLAMTPNFQLTTPAPHLQQSFNSSGT